MYWCLISWAALIWGDFSFAFAPQHDPRYAKLLGIYANYSQIDIFKLSTFKKFDACFCQLDGKSVLVSSEHLWRLDIETIAEIKCYLQKYFEKLQVICYLREPVSFSVSAWSTNVRGGGTKQKCFNPKLFDADHSQLFNR